MWSENVTREAGGKGADVNIVQVPSPTLPPPLLSRSFFLSLSPPTPPFLSGFAYPPIIMLLGRFLLCVPQMTRETSFLPDSASSGASSSNGMRSDFRENILECGLVRACCDCMGGAQKRRKVRHSSRQLRYEGPDGLRDICEHQQANARKLAGGWLAEVAEGARKKTNGSMRSCSDNGTRSLLRYHMAPHCSTYSSHTQ